MRIVVTGKTGQLARALLERGAAAGATVVPLGRPEFDLTRPADARDLLAATRPDVIVSAAAYTAVDKAEDEPDLAFAVNAEGPRALARAAAGLGLPLLHISTDYVFDGTKATPWTEDDTPAPLGVYGASKLAGEQAVLAEAPDSTVLRIGWVYSPFSTNFAKTILRLAGERDTLRIVADQLGGPTSALDAADGILAVARNMTAEPGRRDLGGVFHMAPGGEASWAEFAAAICDWLAANRGRRVAVEPITTADYPTKARRPANSRLDSGRLAAVHGVRLPEWHTSLPRVLERLAASRSPAAVTEKNA
jgi:dTDP-4-dehydrorhamnose reductase